MFLVIARQSRTFQLLMLAWAARCVGSWMGTQPGQWAPAGPRDVPCHSVSCSACKAWGEEEGRGGCLEWWRLSSQV